MTSGTLDERDDGGDDRITLYCDGDLVADFTVPKGRGAAFLADCGLEQHKGDDEGAQP